MKKVFFLLLLAVVGSTQAQERYTEKNKGKFFLFWGGNRGYYNNSDITFRGDD